MNHRIQQNYRIEIETVEKLMDMKALTGISINEIVNGALKAFVDKNANMFPVKEDLAEEKTERNNTLTLGEHEETKW